MSAISTRVAENKRIEKLSVGKLARFSEKRFASTICRIAKIKSMK